MVEVSSDKVISGGLVVPMRPQISVELLGDGDIRIDTATVSDDFEHVEIRDVCFPVECAKAIADELYRLANLSEVGGAGPEG